MIEHRQKILVAVLAAMLLYFGGEWGWKKAVEEPLAARRDRAETLTADLDARRRETAQFRRDAKELAVWEAQSLPSNPEIARSLYQAWLLELVNRVRLANPHVDSGQPANRRGLYRSIAFTVQGRGTLKQWTRLLYEFYLAGHLHQIRSVVVTPLADGSQFDVFLTIEALILPTADREDQLSTTTSDKLAFETLSDYQVIVRRNLFAPGGSSDPSDHTFLTAVNYVSGNPEAWFTLRTEDKIVKLGKGGSLEAGDFHGKVLDIQDEDVILEADGQRWLITVGESLADAYAVPPEF